MKALACLDMNFGGARPAPNHVAYKVNQTECQSTKCARDVRGTDEPHAECCMQTPCKEEGWVRAGGCEQEKEAGWRCAVGREPVTGSSVIAPETEGKNALT